MDEVIHIGIVADTCGSASPTIVDDFGSLDSITVVSTLYGVEVRWPYIDDLAILLAYKLVSPITDFVVARFEV